MNETKRRGRDRTVEVDVVLALTELKLGEALTKLFWELIPDKEPSECQVCSSKNASELPQCVQPRHQLPLMT
jgi:hypothetical protein